MNRISNVSIANKINLKFPLLYAEAKGNDKVEIEYLGNCGDKPVSDCIDKVYHDDNLQWVSSYEADGFATATYILKTKGSDNACDVNKVHKFKIEIYRQRDTGLILKAHYSRTFGKARVRFFGDGFDHTIPWADFESFFDDVEKYVNLNGLRLVATVHDFEFLEFYK